MNAPDKAMEIKAVIVAAASIAVDFLGNVGMAVIIFLAAMLLDYVTGSWAAKAHGEWSSKKAREGLWHKLGEILALCVAALTDIAIGYVILTSAAVPIIPGEYRHKGYVTLIVSVWYIFTEMGSILENVAKLGAPVPKWMIEGVGRMKKKIDKQESERLNENDSDQSENEETGDSTEKAEADNKNE